VNSCRNKARAGLVSVAAVALLLTSFSSSSSAATPSGGGRGITNSEITVGGIVTTALFGTDMDKVAEAVFNQANKSGEIPGGRKIHYVPSVQDQGTPDGALLGLRQLVQQDNAFAVVPELSEEIDSGSASYMAEQQIPGVGWGVTTPFCTKDPNTDWLFGFNGCLNTPAVWPYTVTDTPRSLSLMYKLQGKGGPQGKTVAVIGEASASATNGVAIIANEFKGGGFKVVYDQASVPAPPAQVTDFSPYVQALMTSNGGKPPDAIFVAVTTVGNALNLMKALHQAGYKGDVIGNYYAPQLAAAEAGSYASATFATPESSSPAMKQIVSLLNGAGVTAIGQPEMVAYLSSEMFVQILKKVGPDLTAQRFREVASHFTFSVPGVAGPTPYPTSFLVGPSCAEIAYDNGTTWSIASPYTCYGTTFKKEGSTFEQVPYPSAVKF
jgi:ABC-type branched-subunit amino acid transport system substrate-binding protein